MIPSKVKKDLLDQSEIVQKQFQEFVKDRINLDWTNQSLVTNEGKKSSRRGKPRGRRSRFQVPAKYWS